MIGWGYGHYFVFAAVAALGAGLQVAADTTHEATQLTAAGRCADRRRSRSSSTSRRSRSSTRGRRSAILAPIAVVAFLVLVVAVAATWIGVPLAVLVMGLLVSTLVAINVVIVPGTARLTVTPPGSPARAGRTRPASPCRPRPSRRW